MKKQSFWNRVSAFMTGRGFYMALVCCLMAIGMSCWYLWRSFQTAATLDTTPANGAAHVTTPEPEDTSTDDASTPAETPSADFDAADDEAEEATPDEASSEVIGQTVTEVETPVIAPADIPAEAPMEEEIPPADIPAADSAAEWQMPVEGEVAMAFSHDALSYNAAMGDWRIHDGVDFSAGFGDEVLSACAGTVSAVEHDLYLGWTVKVDCGNDLTVLYGNLAEDCVVDVGDQLAPGDLIGAVGDTAPGEASATAWLHFAVEQNGEAVDPMDYLPA